ncbi:MAG: division/cell wall cluster transcriptional repressor MraZ [Candidatus Omnitrophota bacterium]
MFYGEHLHTLDKKNRLIVPSRFRTVITEKGIESLYVTRGLDECLFIFSDAEWQLQENKFKDMPFTKREVRKFKRLFFSGAVEVVPDKQWRILIPDYLKEYAKLSKDIMVVGVSNRIEVWAKDKWNSYYETSKDSYEEVSENMIEF